MAISCDQVNAYASQFLPTFQFSFAENVFPVDVPSYLVQCAEGDWTVAADPHRGTAAVQATVPLSLAGLTVLQGCAGGNTPIDPASPLPSSGPTQNEFFLDFAGWPGLQEPVVQGGSPDFTQGDDTYTRNYFLSYFQRFNPAITGIPLETRNIPDFPQSMSIYCEAAWAGAFTRLDISNGTGDFAQVSLPAILGGTVLPDPRFDPYFVLTYYLFYPLTEPTPAVVQNVATPNQVKREGQWEAVSFYFKSLSDVRTANDLELSSSPWEVTPDYVMLSYGINRSGDGHSPGMATNYPAKLAPSWPQGGQASNTNLGGGLAGFGNPVYVTAGTHKNLTSPTPTLPVSSTNPALIAGGGALEGTGGVLAGVGGPVGIVIGLLLVLFGFIMQLLATNTTQEEVPDSDGDIADGAGPYSAAVENVNSSSPNITGNLQVFSTLPDNASCEPPPWWSYPGRWGVAVAGGAGAWDSGGRRIDFIGRSRAYWNTVNLQAALDAGQ